MKTKIIYSVFLMCLFLSSLTFIACIDEPTKEEQLKLIQQLWIKSNASRFLIPNDNEEEFHKLGFKYELLPAGLKADTAFIKELEVVDRKEAKNSGENQKEIKMIIRVSGSIKTYNFQTDHLPLYDFMGYENFTVKHTYYFTKNKFDEWSVESDYKIVK